jgi:hypothetical protein
VNRVNMNTAAAPTARPAARILLLPILSERKPPARFPVTLPTVLPETMRAKFVIGIMSSPVAYIGSTVPMRPLLTIMHPRLMTHAATTVPLRTFSRTSLEGMRLSLVPPGLTLAAVPLMRVTRRSVVKLSPVHTRKFILGP